MVNLTIAVNALLRGYLEEHSGVRLERREAGRKLLELTKSSGMSSGGKGIPGRQELYDRPIGRYRRGGPL